MNASNRLSREVITRQRRLDAAREDHRLSKFKVAGVAVLWTAVWGYLLTVVALTIATLGAVDRGDLLFFSFLVCGMLSVGLVALTIRATDGWGTTRTDLRNATYAYEDATLDASGL